MKHVLFICTHNAARSQMAQAFFEREAPEGVRADSAGSDPAPELWPWVLQVMREVGIDLASRRPRKLTAEDQLRADWAVTMGCGDVCPYVPSIVESWDIPDPVGRPIEEVREIRYIVAEHVHRLIVERVEDMQSDGSAHERRLREMLPSLVTQFERRRTPEEIRSCADAILDRYDHVLDSTHILALAGREAQNCLEREHCDALSAT